MTNSRNISTQFLKFFNSKRCGLDLKGKPHIKKNAPSILPLGWCGKEYNVRKDHVITIQSETKLKYLMLSE